VIKIRYRNAYELSPGLHAAAVRHGHNTTVFLLPGLTTAERRAALRRLRLSARMGYCPPLPPAQLALALAADRIRTTVGQVGTLVRSHPAGSTVPVMVLSAGAIAFLALSAVSIQVLHIPRDPGRSSALAIATGRPPGMSSSAPPRAQPTATPGGPLPAVPDTRHASSTGPAAPSPPRPLPSATSSPASSPSASATPSMGPADPTPTPEAAPTTASPAASPSPSPAMQVPSPGQPPPCLGGGPGGGCP
jgi:hypothetical protein